MPLFGQWRFGGSPWQLSLNSKKKYPGQVFGRHFCPRWPLMDRVGGGKTTGCQTSLPEEFAAQSHIPAVHCQRYYPDVNRASTGFFAGNLHWYLVRWSHLLMIHHHAQESVHIWVLQKRIAVTRSQPLCGVSQMIETSGLAFSNTTAWKPQKLQLSKGSPTGCAIQVYSSSPLKYIAFVPYLVKNKI